jgi:hypothetical protein
MGGLFSIAIGMGFIGIAGAGFFMGSTGLALIFGGAGVIMIARGFKGQGISGPGDIASPIDFMTNPGAAIIDGAVGRVEELVSERKNVRRRAEAEAAAAEAGKPSFDPDAVIARYLENRPAAAEVASAPQGFGRKRA